MDKEPVTICTRCAHVKGGRKARRGDLRCGATNPLPDIDPVTGKRNEPLYILCYTINKGNCQLYVEA